jgi:ubiquinone/menaquinone biosynthesis C-methylase UbiE
MSARGWKVGQNKKAVKQFYDAVYIWYRSTRKPPEQRFWSLFKSAIECTALRQASWPGSVVLNGGCGSTVACRYLSGLGRVCIGLDISREGLVDNMANGEENLILADLENLPFRAEIFDLVIYYGNIHYFEEPGHTLAESFRVTKKDGCVLIWAPNPLGVALRGRSASLLKLFRPLYLKLGRYQTNTHLPSPTMRSSVKEFQYTRDQLKSVLLETGYIRTKMCGELALLHQDVFFLYLALRSSFETPPFS